MRRTKDVEKVFLVSLRRLVFSGVRAHPAPRRAPELRRQRESGGQGLTSWWEQKGLPLKTLNLLWDTPRSSVYVNNLVGGRALPKLHWFSF